MAASSRIEWTEATWNPVTGCTKVSDGCRHCYAERMARRLQAMGVPKYARGFEVMTHEETLDLPLAWRRPHEIFVNSMGDLFHDEVPLESASSVLCCAPASIPSSSGSQVAMWKSIARFADGQCS